MSPTATTPRIHFSDLVSDFLHYILENNASRTTLIVCGTRDSFLEQLSASVHPRPSARNPSPAYEEQNQHDGNTDLLLGRVEHVEHISPLLTKTIGLLANSRKVRLEFCPTLEHLRAYLSVLRISRDKQNQTHHHGRPMLAILDLVALHCTTSEFSAQGLSRTFAIAVEAAAREKMDLVLCECKDAIDAQNGELGERLWYLHVPLLSGSIRTGEEGAWSGPSVPVKRIAQRWFHFDEKEDVMTDIIDV
ncbi:hypothetical protein VTN00DRAFT_9877 [Thermoascus crustaceus]|uniref:uncharacterized protein n=1 Tax=Thermoascus crustaceus TaxID=5088 RepID=UPI003743DE82